jgi:predicted nuclease of predicted toxin-antitoxin system
MVSFIADECFSGPLLRALRIAGYDVSRSAETLPAAPDQAVLALALTQGRVMLTEDTDFGELTVRLGLPTYGIIRVDLRLLSRSDREARIVAAVRALGDRVIGALVTVEPARTRLRVLIPKP